MATFTRLKSGSWRARVRRKGKYVNETFLRRRDAEEWALDIERRIDRGESPSKCARKEARTFGRLGRLKISELDRERLIQFGRDRAKEGAGPVTLGIDLGYVKTILSHAAAVHGIQLSTEPTDLARIALNRLGLVGKGNERDR